MLINTILSVYAHNQFVGYAGIFTKNDLHWPLHGQRKKRSNVNFDFVFKLGRVFALFPRQTQQRLAKSIAIILLAEFIFSMP